MKETGFEILEWDYRYMSNKGYEKYMEFVRTEMMRPTPGEEHNFTGLLIKAKKLK